MVKRGEGEDNLSLGVQLPSGRFIRPISSNLIKQTRINTGILRNKYFVIDPYRVITRLAHIIKLKYVV